MREMDHTGETGRTGKKLHMSLLFRFFYFLATVYLQFVERLLVVGTGGVKWIKNSQPGVESTVMGAGVNLKNKHGSYKVLLFTLIRKSQTDFSAVAPDLQRSSVACIWRLIGESWAVCPCLSDDLCRQMPGGTEAPG